jgi:branched-chain amino acid aminotransferase
VTYHAKPDFSIPVTRTKTPKMKPSDDALTFGTVFTDHIFVLDYDEGLGWHDPRIIPYESFSLDPASSVLHYAQAVFDGLKAFRGQDGVVRLFRPRKHAERLNRSCERLCIPEIDIELVLESFRRLVGIDQDWVPSKAGTSLYLRPTVIANESFLGVRPARSYTYFLILSPVGPYYAEGMNPVKILASDQYVRAVPGGLGAAKTAANYAASLYGAEVAKKAGYTQVLWLDGIERKYLDEVGTMNIMVKIGDEVITPPLNGAILAGVTRDSILTLMKDWGLTVSERQISIDDVIAASKNGTLAEMWGTGTAAVVSPVGELGYKDEKIIINGGKTGPLTQKLYDAIVGIQYGATNDPHDWLEPLAAEG